MTDPAEVASSRRGDVPFALAAFLGSSLVFVVQPMIAKQLLPTLGGAPAVWTTCVLFFQAALLVGYAWAHLGPRWLGDRGHAVAHVALLLVAFAFLPLGVTATRLADDRSPALAVLAVLTRSIGVPIAVLCATSPLIQRWHVALRPRQGDRVYRLYAIGNVASLLVLLAYPLVIEPTLTLRHQLAGWSGGFVGLSVLLALLALHRLRASRTVDGLNAGATPRIDDAESGAFPRRRARHERFEPLAWVTLSAIPSSLLLGVTTYLTTDVAAVPFLWVVPLALYLGAFSLAFAGRAPARVVRYAIAPGLAVACLLLVGGVRTRESDDAVVRVALSAPAVIALRAGAFFLLVWSVLASLYARRPADPGGLTGFYLWIAVGGVIGGAFNSLVAPRVFDTTLEYPIVLALAAIVSFAGAVAWRDSRSIVAGAAAIAVVGLAAVYAGSETRSVFVITAAKSLVLLAAPIALFVLVRRLPSLASVVSTVIAISLGVVAFGGQPASVARRSFFGVHRVGPAPGLPFLLLNHGTTVHGQQYYDARTQRTVRPDEPLIYYHRLGPLGAILSATSPRRIGVVGLGAGSIAAYVGAGQSLTYYEIDPLVIRIADGGPFTFIAGARRRGASVNVVEGDARVTLARDDRVYDLLVLDAFSGDAIPAHLLTREAFALYARHLAPGGTLAVHISNRYLDLSGVVAASAGEVGPTGRLSSAGEWPSDPDVGLEASTWAVITRDPSVAASLGPPRWQALVSAGAQEGWTDDYSNLLHVLK